jgi:hypothetical protein
LRILTIPGLPQGGNDVSAPAADRITGELDTLRRLNSDARAQLELTRGSIARKQQEIGVLELHEFGLVQAIDGRERKIDRLLDQMLTDRQESV